MALTFMRDTSVAEALTKKMSDTQKSHYNHFKTFLLETARVVVIGQIVFTHERIRKRPSWKSTTDIYRSSQKCFLRFLTLKHQKRVLHKKLQILMGVINEEFSLNRLLPYEMETENSKNCFASA